MGNLQSFVDENDDDSDENDFNQDETDAEDVNENYAAVLVARIIDRYYFNGNVSSIKKEKINLDFDFKTSLDDIKKNPIYFKTIQESGNGFNIKKPFIGNQSVVKMIEKRQNGVKSGSKCLNIYEKRKVNNLLNVPNNCQKSIFNFDTKVFCGKISKNGEIMIAASQDGLIKVCDATTPNYKIKNTLHADNIGWSILDISISPKNDFFVFATWSDCFYLHRLNGVDNDIIRLPLKSESPRFCIFSCEVSNCGKKIIGCSSDSCIYVYDGIINTCSQRSEIKQFNGSPEMDINSVGFTDETSNIIFSGGDDCIIKIWDIRCMSENAPKPVGVFVGHTDGIIHIDTKNDGRYILSNSKDQSIKLWDLRSFSTRSNEEFVLKHLPIRRWDYRWHKIPNKYYNNKKQEIDASILTVRGHRVQKSLIRSRFSPLETTGQRYIYTGCSTGRIIIYDIITGNIVEAIDAHSDIVRDVAWHPNRQEILSYSWDCRVNLIGCSNIEDPNRKDINLLPQAVIDPIFQSINDEAFDFHP